MKDRVGQNVEAGDLVAYCRPSYSELCVGKVRQLTPKGVSIEQKGRSKTLFRGPRQFVRVNP